MNIEKAIELTKEYTQCPDCGSDKGKVFIDEESFHRICECGFPVYVSMQDT